MITPVGPPVRLNTNGLPKGVPKEHYRSYGKHKGKPKLQYCKLRATIIAMEASIERVRDGKSDRGMSQAYKCAHCGWWHVGSKSRSRSKREALYAELGPRAFKAMVQESSNSRVNRLKSIMSRTRPAMTPPRKRERCQTDTTTTSASSNEDSQTLTA